MKTTANIVTQEIMQTLTTEEQLGVVLWAVEVKNLWEDLPTLEQRVERVIRWSLQK